MDELYYDADTDEQKQHYWLNNQICGTFNRWKLRSVLPLGDFMRRLRKNKEPPVNVVQIDKDIYEKQVKEMREKAIEKKEAKKKFKRMNKIIGNNNKIRFDEES